MIDLQAALTAIATLLAQADPAVAVGHPSADARGLRVWPWRVTVNASAQLPPRRPDGSRGPNAPAFDVRLLILPPTDAIDGIALLDRAWAAITATPAIQSSAGSIRLVLDSGTTPAELGALFVAARVPMTLSLEVTAHVTQA